MNKSKIPRIYAVRPWRALAILDYLLYLDTTWDCNFIEASRDWITQSEWNITQMYVLNKNLRKNIPQIKEKLYSLQTL